MPESKSHWTWLNVLAHENNIERQRDRCGLDSESMHGAQREVRIGPRSGCVALEDVDSCPSAFQGGSKSIESAREHNPASTSRQHER